MAVSRSQVLTVLDVGTSKTACLIAIAEPGGFRVLGAAAKRTYGVRRGGITDMDAVEDTIRATVAAAEKNAEIHVEEVFVALSGGAPASQTVRVEISLSDKPIGDGDVHRLLRQAGARSEPGERSVLHVVPVAYSLDGSPNIADPRGMYGRRLGVEVHMASASSAMQTSLDACVRRAMLRPADLISGGYASGLGGLTTDEQELGTTVVDLGAGVTKLAMFEQGNLVHLESVPIGGSHVTNDIARILSTSIDGAERLKVTRGGVFVGPRDDDEIIDVPPIGEGWGVDAKPMPLSLLIGVIRPRVEEIFETVRERIDSSGYGPIAGRKVVLTGGGSMLNGIERLAHDMLDRPVRRGRPMNVSGLPESMQGPAYAALVGCLGFAQRRTWARQRLAADNDNQRRASGLFRFGRWLKENL